MYVFTQEQLDQISAAASNTASSHPYADMYDLIYSIIQQPDVLGNVAPGNVIAWFGAAASANRGVGGASDFIRDYTTSQLELRTGDTVSNVDTLLQAASNDIAAAVLADIISSDVVVDGQTLYELPTVHEIGEHDALEAMDVLSVYSPDPAVWSGNPLFLGLGDGSFWQDNILQNAGDTYNLFTTVESFKRAGLTAFLNGGTADLLNLFWSQGESGRDQALNTVSEGYNAANVFLSNAYGGYIGSGLGNMAATSLVIGSEEADFSLEENLMSTPDTFIHGGAGDDLLVGSLGNDLLDGGADNDLATFSDFGNNSSLQFTAIIDRVETDAQFSAEVTSEGVNSALFNIEHLTLGINDDVLAINELATDTTALVSVNGAENGQFGDTVDLSQLQSTGVSVSLTEGAAAIESDGQTLEIEGFENVVGAASDDEITGNAENNILVGGGGADALAGGAGNDVLVVDAADLNNPDGVNVSGGEGRDVLYVDDSSGVEIDMTALSVETAIGGGGQDTIRATASGAGEMVLVAGGDGNDVIHADGGGSSGGTAVLWGGAGADTFYLESGGAAELRIMTANVAGLTSENFATFDTDLLGLGSNFDWSEVDYLILNPDVSDTFYDAGPDGAQLGTQNVTYNVIYGYDEHYGVTPYQIASVSETVTLASDPSGTDIEGEDSWATIHEFSTSFANGLSLASQSAVFGKLRYYWDEVAGSERSYALASVEQYNGFHFSYYTQYSYEGESYWNSSQVPSGAIQVAELDSGYWPFVVFGGGFQGESLSASGAVSGVMPESNGEPSVIDWLESFGASGSLESQTDANAGSHSVGGDGQDSFTLNTGDAFSVVSNFNVNEDTVVVNGITLNPNEAEGAANVSQEGNNTVVSLSTGEMVILKDVDLETWQAAQTEPMVEGDQDPANLDDLIDYYYSADPDGDVVSNGDDVISGGLGNDTLNGGNGNDTYVYALGDGNDLIDDKVGFNRLDLSSFNAADVSFRADGNHDLFIDFADGATVEVNYQFRYDATGSNRISEIVFADGTLDEAAIHSKALADQSGNATVLGTYGWDDTLQGDSSDQALKGGNGDDTYVYNLGDGNDTIEDKYGFNRLDLSSFNAADVSFRANGNHDMFIDFADGSTVEVNYQFRYDAAGSNRISEIVFADGALDEAAIHSKALADQSDKATVLGTYGWDDTLQGDSSNQTLKGGNGDDTYVYNLGDGNDTIDDTYGFNRLDLSGFNAADVSFRPGGVHDMFIDFADGATVEVHYQFRYNAAGSNRISEIVFADGTLDEASIHNKALADQSSNATVLGTYGWDDILRGDGSDQTFEGSNGNDTFVFAAGDGNDTIADFTDTQDLLQFEGFAFEDLSISQDGNDVLVAYGATDTVRVADFSAVDLTAEDFVFV
ncbi:hypothetical protein K3722_04200 [Leisingera caerulea]|uniref:Uncharacterized protein n=1 Tax=Leisingera caerulea TaxID=506591 RepID=A0ABY5WYG6_LEICA|nr:hypothetical protein [Leisingera caerulea]UWQ59337.1 hypothetical protein K3722_04200 [Leisingera caerulea]